MMIVRGAALQACSMQLCHVLMTAVGNDCMYIIAHNYLWPLRPLGEVGNDFRPDDKITAAPSYLPHKE